MRLPEVKFHSWVLLLGLFLLLPIIAMLEDLQDARWLTLELESDRYFSGSVSKDTPTITTPHFKDEAVLYSYKKYEEYKDSDGDTQRRLLASSTRCARDFVIDSPSDGRVVVSCRYGADELAIAKIYRERRQEKGNFIFVEWIVPPGAQRLTVLGRPRSGVFGGRVRAYRGSPQRWLYDSRQDAIFSILVGILLVIVSASTIGASLLWLLQRLWGARLSTAADKGEVSMALPRLIRRLCVMDVDEVNSRLDSERWVRTIAALTFTSLLVGAWLAVYGAMALPFIVAMFGISPYEAEGSVRVIFIYGLLGLAAASSIYWTVAELRSLRVKRVRSLEMGHLSDLLLQCVARVASLSDAGASVKLAWRRREGREVSATTRVELAGGEELTLEHTALTDVRGVAAKFGGEADVFAQRWRLSSDEQAQGWRLEQSPGASPAVSSPHEVMARGVMEWLERKEVAASLRREALSEGMSIRLAEVEAPAEWSATHDGREVALRSFSDLGVADVAGAPWAWFNRNLGALLILSVSALLVFGPMFLTAALVFFSVSGEGYSGGVSEWYALPLTLIPGAVLWFRPPELSVRRRRRVAPGAPVFRLQGEGLRLNGAFIDLSRPFRVNLSHETLGQGAQRALLGVVLVQGQGGEASRLSFAVPVEADSEFQGLVELSQRSPLMPPEAFHQWVWPLIRTSAAAHGQRLSWGTEAA